MLTLPLVPNLQLILPLLHLKSERALGALSNISHGFFRFQFKYFTQRQEHSGWSHVKKKKAPLTTVNFLLPVTGGHCGPNGKRACFFPVVFQSFESLSVVTDGRTDGRTH